MEREGEGVINFIVMAQFSICKCPLSSVVAVYPSLSASPPTPRIRRETASETTAVINVMRLRVCSRTKTDPSLVLKQPQLRFKRL